MEIDDEVYTNINLVIDFLETNAMNFVFNYKVNPLFLTIKSI